MNRPLETVSAAQQFAVVRDTATIGQYADFVTSSFGPGAWLNRVRRDVEQKKIFGDEPDPDAIRLLTLSGVAAGLYGFDRLNATIGRHKRHGWDKERVISLPHPTAVMLYCAQGAVDSTPAKKALLAVDASLDPAIWGVYLPIKGGTVEDSDERQKELRISARALRRDGNRVIFLPNEPLAERLVQLATDLGGFNGDKADTVSDAEFHDEFFPKVKKAVNELVEVPVFQNT